MFRSKVQLLAAGVSVLAINAVAVPAAAQDQHQDQGVYQSGPTNVYTVPDGAFPAHPPYHGPDTHGEWYSHFNPGGLADADASVTTDTGATPAANPGMIHQDAFFDANPSNTINVNSGTLTVRADARAGGAVADADAQFSDDANGIGQHIFAFSTAAVNDINVAAGAGITIRAQAIAQASTGTASASASITEGAIEQWIFSGPNGRNEVTNDGVISLLVDAGATALLGDANATANLDGFGIGQQVDASEAANVVDNSGGTIDVTSSARALAPTGVATARAFMEIGVGQLANGDDLASGVIDNNGGTINVAVAAVATGDTAIASATLGDGTSGGLNLEGIGQRSYSTDADGVASNTLNNASPIDITANAEAFADVGNARAFGSIETGIYQDASAGQTANDTLTNGTGALTIHANARAVAQNPVTFDAGRAYAYAYIGTGIEQNATAFGTDDDSGKAAVAITNNGTVDIGADAAATADSRAIAYAYMATGIAQFAEGQTEASATISNNAGTIDINAGAVANGQAFGLSTGAAYAYALVANGITQSAIAFTTTTLADVIGDADVALTNSGTLNITASADVDVSVGQPLATEGDAFAFAEVDDAIRQQAYAATEASATLTNALGGTINIAADAQGAAANGDAYAYAYVGTGVRQYASAQEPGVGLVPSEAAVAFLNNGTFNVHANATATANVTNVTVGPPAVTTFTGEAYALGSIGRGVEQYAIGLTLASVDFTNNGLFDIRATAGANGGSDAYAYGFIDTGVAQYAYADAEDAVASVSVVNSGTLNVVADVAATGASGAAYAGAGIEHGIRQYAYAVGESASADASLSNAAGGVINISAAADAMGTQAYAWADLDEGISQRAMAGGEDADATVGLTNNGTVTIAGVANANSDGTEDSLAPEAYAWGGVDIGIEQYAYAQGENADASAVLTNGGMIDISGNADAAAAEGFAYANGDIGVGIGQYAYASQDGGDASVDLNNLAAGTVNVTAGALANGFDAYAYASIDVGIGQRAHADDAQANVDVTLVNAGTLTIAADAGAIAGEDEHFSYAYAYAYAYVDVGIGQIAITDGIEGNATASIVNDGNVAISGRAAATASEYAYAFGFVADGIAQEAYANGSEGDATVTLTNVGSISVNAEADAVVANLDDPGDSPDDAYAYAFIGDGIYQLAVANGEDGDANVTLTNEGSISVVADAFASGVDARDVNAYARIYDGIDQEAIATGDSGNATVGLTNAVGGTILVSAVARAEGSTANAEADIETGVDQFALANDDEGDAIISLTNNGTLTVSVAADAVASESSAFASASVTEFGVLQEAVADGEDGEASVTLTNTGTLRVIADAAATSPESRADAHAFVDNGIGQYAYAGDEPGGDADAVLVNSGGIDLSAVALAKGSDAAAYASIDTGIVQYAYADGTDGNANVSLTNSGTIEGDLTATATATNDLASAYAIADRFINQYAYADGIDGIATAAITNGPGADAVAEPGRIALDLNATANAANQRPPFGGFAYAYAVVDEMIAQYANADGEGGRATVTLANNGLIELTASADAQGDFGAVAIAQAENIVQQRAVAAGTDGQAFASLTNSGDMTINGEFTANATGAAFGVAEAGVWDAVFQHAYGSGADVELTNDGTFTLAANADAFAGVFAYADAYADAILQVAVGGTHASALVENNGELTVASRANALAGNITPFGGDASAYAYAAAIEQRAVVLETGTEATATITTPLGAVFDLEIDNTFGAGPATVTVTNTAAIDVSAVATATGTNGFGFAYAGAFGIDQYAQGSEAHASVTNDAPLTVAATANADGGAFATAYADGFGIWQEVEAISYAYAGLDFVSIPPPGEPLPDTATWRVIPAGPASVTVENNSAIDVTADATAVTAAGAAKAMVGGFTATTTTTAGTLVYATGVQGIWQQVFGSEASALVTNSADGSITVAANADATGVEGARAAAFAEGVLQFATAAEYAYVGEFPPTPRGGPEPIDTFTFSITPTGDVDVTLVNDGTISLTAGANAVAGTGAAFASVAGQTEGFFNGVAQLPAAGVVQYGHGLDVTLSVENNGSLTVDANAAAEGGTAAAAWASGAGILQLAGAFGWTATATQTQQASEDPVFSDPIYTVAAGGVVSVSVTNTDTIDVSVTADANAATAATATANAIGVGQVALGEEWDATLINNGDLLVSAVANATAATGIAVAHASAIGYGLVASGGVLTVVNTDTIDVTADAGATGTASANAVGITAVGTVIGTGVGATPGLINGTITNSGIIDVRALVSQGTDATATGITVSAASAAPVTPTPAAGDPRNLIITNDGGTITAAVSYNGGAAPAAVTWHRGMAIDVSDANVGGTLISLTGAGTIYGNIDLSDVADDPLVAGVEGDEIVVSDGETNFDGIVNPEWAEAPLGPQPGEAPSASQGVDPSPTFGGTLSILPGGSLFLRDNSVATNTMYDGPAQAYVSTLNTAGNLVYELQISGPNANAHYPQIFTNTANLGGTLEIRRTAVPGPVLYDDVYYDNIIEADVRNGKFTNANDVPIWTPPSIFVGAKIIYDANNNVDINIDRTEFDVACANFGGTFNQCSAAGGIENVYSTSLTGPFAGVVANLFTLNQAGYLDALNQLAGAQYASYLQGLRNNSFATNSIVSDQIDCAISIRAVDQCRDRNGTGRFWVMGKYNWADYDGDHEAGAYDLKGWTGMVGADYTFGNFTVGGFVGYRDIDLNFDWYDGDMSATGWQGGLYAGYDVGSFYVRGIGSYSSLDGDSKRDLNFATTIGTLEGDPDVNIVSFYGEAGARFDMGSSWLTPFVAVDYTDIKLKSFTETGPAAVVGAALAFDSQHEKQTSTLVGVKWAGNWGGIVPEAKLAWRHDFGDRTFDFDARFAGAPAGSDHRIISSRIDRESVVGGLSLAAAFGSKTTGRIGYQGRFNSDVTDHSVYGSLTFHFGGAPAPAPEPIPTPPAPPPAAEPAPPPAVVAPGPFIVFFDWDKSDITPQAAAILDNAAAAYQQTGSAQVMLAGNADRSGPADYNVGLSQRRADAVKAYLAGRGIPENVITTEANGENRPIVETADGVREPQNRNVQITYGPGSGQ